MTATPKAVRGSVRSRHGGLVALLLGASVALAGVAISPASRAVADPSPDPKKVYVCKYVGTPGVDERLQTGDNPISVSVSAIPAGAAVGAYFADQHGRSFVLAFDVGQPEPRDSACPGTTPPSTTSTTTTTTTAAPTTTTTASPTTTEPSPTTTVQPTTTMPVDPTATTTVDPTATTTVDPTTTTPVEPTTTTPIAQLAPTPGTTTPSGVATVGGELPTTGSTASAMAVLGVVLVAAGVTLHLISRRRPGVNS